MSTINKTIADEIITHKGYYPGDHTKVTKIVTYNNMFNGGLEYACVYSHENPYRYEGSPACIDVKTYWEIKG
jgi:hypothetical protein